MANITIVSMGPGSIDHLTWEAVQALYNADILIGSKKFKDLYPEYVMLSSDHLVESTIQLVKENLDKKIAVLVTGDAGFYSLGKSIIREFGRKSVNVVAGVSVVQLAFAKLCEPWQDARFISVHGRDAEVIDGIIDDKFLILCDNKNSAANIVSKLIGLIESHDIFVMEDLGLENEKITAIQNPTDTEKLNNSSLSVVIGIRREHE
ncbi:precorrin-6y C5,15-methyltransferase (decarboxylating), CbiE subunit [Denitrovibrio acetiphilus DSM 12809]|uniref:Precorrin-6y C5,15-methyltransferase (Decarboxylating), CbiE subunit n=1 Tax=Denitrovibrio acetiphilus (strain DSM 12809 / NBRC 114555 / N2460) TaxID=522772 RepID=D4H1Z0_DENA2|nr:precorrin-6y C5,15-methyltransferase (decarboxylating) subunit CbiE [Denitrovibrio acetiphilus]ADD66967.1 precorrin-6y C5,15-methyltransferase (decarboxylating), CbiE subunit [Denitrovibrio acetiphilus DSM 12809]